MSKHIADVPYDQALQTSGSTTMERVPRLSPRMRVRSTATIALAFIAFTASLLSVTADELGSHAEPLLVTIDDGNTWHPLENEMYLRRDDAVQGPLPVRVARSPSEAPLLALPALCRVSLVAWHDGSYWPETASIPFAVGWTSADTIESCEAANVDTTEQEALVDANTTIIFKIDRLVSPLMPRWIRGRHTFSEDDALREEEKKAKEEKAKSRGRWRRYGFPVAILAIIALAHGIYLGITAVEEEEKERRRVEGARQEHSRGRSAQDGRRGGESQQTFTAHVPRRRKSSNRQR